MTTEKASRGKPLNTGKPIKQSPELPESPDHRAPQSRDPLVFISHDTRDADLAEAFSKLLKSISAGMLKSFRSSDRKGTDGIEFGDEWYKRLMTMLETSSDVVCLFTERSLDRPWILYEAGVAKGKLNTPVHGIAIGVPLSRVSVGPFYQFQNSDDSTESLTKLVLQLARRIPGLEPDLDVVSTQVDFFRKATTAISGQPHLQNANSIDDASPAKLFEEVKLMFRDLPSQVEEKLSEHVDPSFSRRGRRYHPMMFRELLRIRNHETDPIPLLIVFSLLREDFPWLFEIGHDLYEGLKRRSARRVQTAMNVFFRVMKFSTEHPIMDEFVHASKHTHMVFRELPRFVEEFVHRFMHQPETSNEADPI